MAAVATAVLGHKALTATPSSLNSDDLEKDQEGLNQDYSEKGTRIYFVITSLLILSLKLDSPKYG